MARIAGVNIPTQKRVEIGLRYIHGIGPAKAHEIIEKVGISPSLSCRTSRATVPPSWAGHYRPSFPPTEPGVSPR